MFRKICICFILSTQIILLSSGQGVLKVDKVPPSPTAASLGTYGDIPVSYHTGRPNISIPLGEIGYKEMKVPISLSYDASGIKVAQPAGWVGTNWSLSAGGVINRVMRKLPDEHLNGFFNNGPEIPAGMSGLTYNNYVSDVEKGIIDLEPDIFIFNFPGGSGKFFYDQDKQIQLVSQEKLKIEGRPGQTTWFRITTPDGTIYHFNETESTTIPANGIYPAVSFVSSWYLSNISHPKYPGKQIVFSYVSENITSGYKVKTESRKSTIFGETAPQYSAPYDTDVSYNAKVLSSITAPNSRVRFLRSGVNRTDLSGSQSLYRVLFDKMDFSSYLESHYFQFSYSYYPGGGKLRLDSVGEFVNGQAVSPPHSFEYISGNLPATNAVSKDFWGYHNGKNNTSLLHGSQLFIYGADLTEENVNILNVNGGDRKPDPAFTAIGTLNKITYPTGGHMFFEYENNVVDPEVTYQLFEHIVGGGMVFSCNPNGSTSLKLSHDYIQEAFQGFEVIYKVENQEAFGGDPSSPFTESSYVFQIDGRHNIKGFVQIMDSGQSANINPSQFPFAKLEKKVNGVFQNVKTYTGSGVWNETHDLTPGEYRISVRAKFAGDFFDDYARFRIEYIEKTTNKISEVLGPGLRIKKMTSHDGITTANDQVTNFSYLDTNGKLSGVIYDIPILNHMWMSPDNIPFMMQNSNNKYESYGNPIGYGKVKVTKQNEGIEIYRFENIPPELFRVFNASDNRQYPFIPAYYSFWESGSLLEKEVFKIVGTQNILVSKDESNYEYELEEFIAGTSVSILYYKSPPDINCVESGTYSIPLIRKLLKEKSSKLFENGQQFQTRTLMDYEAVPKHFQAVKVTNIENSGNELCTYYYYPEDYRSFNISSLNTLMNTHFIHHIPVETFSTYKNAGTEYVVSGGFTDFDGLRPINSWNLELDNPVNLTSFSRSALNNGTKDARYKLDIAAVYGSDGNIIRTSQNGRLISYGWAHNGENVVWQTAHNLTTDIFGFTSFESNDKGGWVYAQAPAKNSNLSFTGNYYLNLGGGNIYRSSLPASPSNKYILSFWARTLSGSASIVINSNTTTSFNINTQWSYITREISSSEITISGNSNILVDELRIYPQSSSFKSISHEPGVGIRSENSPDGMVVRYQYDIFRRLYRVLDEKNNILKQYQYKYQASTTD
jgi:hypothetical protein